MKNTNTKAFRATVHAYLAQSILDYTGEDTESARAAYIWQRFDSEYNYSDNVRRYPSLQERVAQWLQGLPLNIAYTYCDIIALAEQWHECKLTEKQADAVIERYFSFMAFRLIQLWEKHGIDVHKASDYHANRFALAESLHH